MVRILIATLVSLVLIVTPTYSTEATKEYLSTFIPKDCCYTNDCCWSIKETEVTDLGNNLYRINATGQQLKASGFSPDGLFYRCACDYNPTNGTWNKHQNANTRCLFIPSRGS